MYVPIYICICVYTYTCIACVYIYVYMQTQTQIVTIHTPHSRTYNLKKEGIFGNPDLGFQFLFAFRHPGSAITRR